MNRILPQIAAFLAYLLAQVLFFDHFTLFRMATPYVFILFLLMIPVTIPLGAYMLIAFVSGLLIDMFSTHTLIGLHAFSCVLMVVLRDPWIDVFTNRTSFKGKEDMFLRMQPFNWYVTYFVPLLFVHHLAYYMLEEFGFGNFGYTIGKVFFSVLFSAFFILSGTYLFYKRKPQR